MNKKYVLSLFLAIILSNSVIGKGMPSKRLLLIQQILLKEEKILNRYFHTNVKVLVGLKQSFADVGKNLIVVGLKDIESFEHTINGIELQLPIQILLAHEMGHMLQGELSTLSLQTPFLFEAWADVHSGNYVRYRLMQQFRSFYETNVQLALQTVKQVDSNQQRWEGEIYAQVSNAIKFFNLVGEEMDNDRHPNGRERTTAFKIGMNYGLLNGLSEIVKNIRSSSTEERKICQEFLDVLYKHELPKVDFQPDEDFNSWSLRQAKKTIHFNSDLHPFITMTAINISPDALVNRKFIRFDMQIKNSSAYPIIFFASIEGFDPIDYKVKGETAILPVCAKSLRHIVPPFSSIQINDSMAYAGDFSNMPSIENSLGTDFKYCYEVADSNQGLSIAATSVNYPIKGKTAVDWLASLMHGIYSSALTNCDELRGSPSWVTSLTDTANRNFLCYYSDWNFIADISNNKLSYVKLILYQGKDSILAFQLYKKAVEQADELSTLDIENPVKYEKRILKRSDGEGYTYRPINSVPETTDHFWQIIFRPSSNGKNDYDLLVLFINKKWTGE